MKYFKQKNDYYCGPAVMQIILSSIDIKKSQVQLARELKTNSKKGTPHKQLTRLAKKYFKAEESTGKLPDLKNKIIIVCYYLPKEKTGHYAIIKRINKNKIHLIDTYFGKDHSINLNYFKKHMYGTYTPKGWHLTIKTKSQQ